MHSRSRVGTKKKYDKRPSLLESIKKTDSMPIVCFNAGPQDYVVMQDDNGFCSVICRYLTTEPGTDFREKVLYTKLDMFAAIFFAQNEMLRDLGTI